MTGSIRLTGTGTAVATPDVVIANVAIRIRAADVATAFAQAGDRTREAVAAVRSAGLTDRDIATTHVSLRAVETGPWEERRLQGYEASESLTLTIADIANAAQIVTALTVAAGDAARIESIQFALRDATSALEHARDQAFADARNRAQRYAELADARLGPVLSIDEGSKNRPPAAGMKVAAMAAPGESGPAMEVGERSISAHVTVEWELLTAAMR